MKKIKVFIASSRELSEDRDALSRLISSLNHFYTEKGIYIQTYMCEDEDSNFNGRKQDEYDENIEDSDIFICLFWTKAGVYTVEEFNVACQKYNENKKPAIYIYLKDNSNITEEKSLSDFKERLENEMGHFPGRYTHLDTLKFDFLTKWIKFNPVIDYTAITVRNETVFIHNSPTTINVSKIDFVRNNDEYVNIIRKIEKAANRVSKYPDDEDFVNELRELKIMQSEFESSIIDTAVMISKLDARQSSARLEQAIAYFQEGDHKKAIAILNTDTIKKEIDYDIVKLDKLEVIRNEYQLKVKTHIDELMLKANLIVNQFSFNKFDEVENIYSYVLSVLDKLDETTQYEIMYDIARAYRKSCNLSKAIEVLDKLNSYNLDNRPRVLVLSMLGEIYLKLHQYHKATDCFLQTTTICEDNKYNCVTVEETTHLLSLYLSTARFLNLTNDDDYRMMIDMAMSFCNKAYGEEINEYNACLYLYHALYLIEQCGESTKGIKQIQEIQTTIESIQTDECNLQLLQVYNLFGKLYCHNDSSNQFVRGYEYVNKSINVIRRMSVDERYAHLAFYLDTMYIASKYEAENMNYDNTISIVTEALDTVSILPYDRINAFNSEIIQIVFNGVSISLEARRDDESFELSWLNRYLPLIYTAMNKSQDQSDLHSALFCKESFIISAILKGISFEEDTALRLKFNKLLVDLCVNEFTSYDEHGKMISYAVLDSALNLGQQAASQCRYSDLLYYTKAGAFLGNIVAKNSPEESRSILPLFIESMIGLLLTDFDNLDPKVKSESYELLKKADELFIQLDNMDEDVKETYIWNCNNLSLLAIQQGDNNYALNLISRALALKPYNIDLLDTFGEICVSINKLDCINLIINKILTLNNSYFNDTNTPFAEYVKKKISQIK